MMQTLLALLAMMIVTLFSFHQQRNIIHTQMSMIRSEAVTHATTVATDLLQEIGSKAFDHATTDATISSPTDLTLKPHFTMDASGNDIDDYDDDTRVRKYRLLNGDTLWFDVWSEVNYADENDLQSVAADPTIRTRYKKVTVWVQSVTVDLQEPIYLSQTLACGSRCAWQ